MRADNLNERFIQLIVCLLGREPDYLEKEADVLRENVDATLGRQPVVNHDFHVPGPARAHFQGKHSWWGR